MESDFQCKDKALGNPVILFFDIKYLISDAGFRVKDEFMDLNILNS